MGTGILIGAAFPRKPRQVVRSALGKKGVADRGPLNGRAPVCGNVSPLLEAGSREFSGRARGR